MKGCARSLAGTAAIAGVNTRTLQPQTTRNTRPMQACRDEFEKHTFCQLARTHSECYSDRVRFDTQYKR